MLRLDGLEALERDELARRISHWYDDFEQTSDETVLELLDRVRSGPSAGGRR